MFNQETLRQRWFRASVMFFYRKSLRTRAQKAQLRKAKKAIRQNRRVGRLHNGR